MTYYRWLASGLLLAAAAVLFALRSRTVGEGNAELVHAGFVEASSILSPESEPPLWGPDDTPLWTLKPGLEGVHPIPPAGFARSYTAPRVLMQDSWARVVEALDAGAGVTIVVIGGSMTKGHDCGFDRCAWSRHIVPFLRRARPQWNVRLVNVAQGGWGSQQFADIPGVWAEASGADVFIVDTSVNAVENRDTAADLDRLMWRLLHERATNAAPLPPAVMYVQAFATCHKNVAVCKKECLGYRTFLTPVNVSANVPRGTLLAWCPSWWSRGDPETRVARHYGVAISSYRDAAWPVMEDPPPNLGMLWEGTVHPAAETHELFSDVVKHGLAQLLLGKPRSIPRPTTTPLPPGSIKPYSASTDLAVCTLAQDGPLTVIRSDNGKAIGPRPTSMIGDWSFYADRPGKFGWIVESDGGEASITFPVIFSGAPRLEIAVLRSYEGFLDARPSLSGCKSGIDSRGGWPLKGSWRLRNSLPDETSWSKFSSTAPLKLSSWRFHEQGGYTSRVFADSCVFEPGVAQNLTLTVSPRRVGRFKLIALTTC